MKKTSIILIAVVFLSLLILVNPVKATDYEWIQNPSFEDSITGTMWIDLKPSGFQFNEYGWSYTEATIIESVIDYDEGATRIYSTDWLNMSHFTFEELPSNVEQILNVTFIIRAKSSDGTSGLETYSYNYTTENWDLVWDYYTLGTSYYNYTFTTTFQNITGLNEWNINNAIIKLRRENGATEVSVDSFSIRVWVTLGSDLESHEISPYWYSDQTGAYVGVTDSEANTGNWSSYITFKSTSNTVNDVSQNIPFLSTYNVTGLSLYAKTASSTKNATLTLAVRFADDTIYSVIMNTQQINYTEGWKQIVFNTALFPSGKLIKAIRFFLADADESSFTYIDDVSLTATVEYTDEGLFSYYLIPEPYSYSTVNNLMFSVYTLQDYMFYGMIYDFDGNLTYDGVYSVDFELQTDTTGYINNGLFNFTISQRNAIYAGETENIKLTLTVSSGAYVFWLKANWLEAHGLYTPEPTSITDDTEETTNNLINWIVMFVVIFLPALMFAGGIYENNQQPDSMHISPLFGLIAGLCLSIGIGVYTALVPVWILILMVVAIGILIAGLWRSS